MRSFSYEVHVDIPEEYICADCGAAGVKLWREYQTVLEKQALRCYKCAGENQGKDMRRMDKRDWETYWSFYQTILRAIQPPDLMIYLRCSMRTLRQRIRLRGRAMERDVPLSYLKRLERLYDEWIESYDMSDVLVLETDRLDYIHDLVHRLDVMERIEAVLPPEMGKPAC